MFRLTGLRCFRVGTVRGGSGTRYEFNSFTKSQGRDCYKLILLKHKRIMSIYNLVPRSSILIVGTVSTKLKD